MKIFKLLILVYFSSALQLAVCQTLTQNSNRENIEKINTEKIISTVKRIHENLSRVSSVRTTINYSTSNELQMVTVTQGASEKNIVISYGLIDSYRADHDALAFIIAHEMAGISMGIKDIPVNTTLSTSNIIKNTVGNITENLFNSKILGGNSLLRQSLPVGQIATANTDNAINSSITKDNTISADKLAFQWLKNANYDPLAAHRAVQRLISLYQSNKSSNFFNNKWIDSERLTYLKNYTSTDGSLSPKIYSIDLL